MANQRWVAIGCSLAPLSIETRSPAANETVPLHTALRLFPDTVTLAGVGQPLFLIGKLLLSPFPGSAEGVTRNSSTCMSVATNVSAYASYVVGAASPDA